ncbi:hypothetical protein [Deinococcus sp.]|uniref:hypothetical protein n=1 Tax=Deinococcus sp. TaxID=47478 RepID=UPI003B5CAB00
MRKSASFLALLTALSSGPALAWVPKLEEQSAQAVIDSAYGRRAATPTFLTVDLSVDSGKFKAPEGSVTVFDGPETCLSDWLTPLSESSQGSRVASLTLSGQADQLLFEAQDARDNFKNMTVEEALKPADGRLPDGQLRVDIAVKGLNDLQQRSAYLVRLKGPDGKLIAPTRFSFVDDWKQVGVSGAQATATTSSSTTTSGNTTDTTSTTTVDSKLTGPYAGTLVYYFEPLKAGLNANDKVDILLRTEQGACAYDFNLDLGKFN